MPSRPLRPVAPLSKRSMAAALVACFTIATVVACSDDANATEPTARRDYGVEQTLGNGKVRTYVTHASNGAPTEVGVAFSEAAMDGLPAAASAMKADAGMAHADMPAAHNMAMSTQLLLDLPAGHGTQYTFVQLDWNPAGHEPPGIYDLPHFDFHFYNISKAEWNAIDPSNPAYVASARNAPDAQYARAFFVNPAVALNAPAEAVAVPKMGVHWLDAKSPELQGLVGNPGGFKPFTTTYIQGAWNGKFIFEEPMITRAHIMAKKTATVDSVRDQVLPLTSALKASPAGYYPSAYRITYDPSAKEYRIALSGLTYRN
jgi:hypothetical protein